MLRDVAGQTGSALVDAYWGVGMGMSGVVSIMSDGIVPYRDENLAYNLGFTVNDFIYGQGIGDAAQMKMGYFTGDYNGCG